MPNLNVAEANGESPLGLDVAAARPAPLTPPPGIVRVRVARTPPATPVASAGRRRRRGKSPIVVVWLGAIVWAVLLITASDLSPLSMSLVVTPVVLIAVPSAWRAATHEPFGRPAPPTIGALILLGVTPIAAIGGPVVMVLWLLAGGAVIAWPYIHRSRLSLVRGLAAAILPALAGGSLVLSDRQGAQIAMVLIGAYCLFDVANAAMGTGRTGGKVGAVSGIITVLVFAVIVQSILSPPFTGAKAWVLCGAVAVLAPVGVWLCARLAPGRLPALRRLDSLVIAGPVWVIGVRILIHH